MKLIEAVDEASRSLIGAVIAAVLGALFWLVRRVLTSAQQIDMLKAEQEENRRVRDQQRKEDREMVHEIQTDLREIRKDVRGLYQRNSE